MQEHGLGQQTPHCAGKRASARAKPAILHRVREHLGLDCSLSEPLDRDEQRLVRDLRSIASHGDSRLSGNDGVCHRPACSSSIFRDASPVQHELMFCSLVMLTVGFLLRVSSEVLADQGKVPSAWSLLSTPAICEMAAVTVLAFNLLITFARNAPAVATQPLREAE